MLKTLYKLKISNFRSILTLGILSFLLIGCSEEADQTATAVAEPAAAVEEVTDTAEVEAAEAVIEAADVAQSDEAGFLNYDMVLGDENAPVEIIEYASFTCNHCAAFHTQVLPRIKEKYIDTGKAKLIFRSFMLNRVDANISQLTRCVPEKRYFAFADILFTRQENWYNIPEYMRLSEIHGQEEAGRLFTELVESEINKIARQIGMNKKKIDACGANEEIGKYVFSVHQEGIQKYKVNSTPTIIVNGKAVLGNDFNSIEKAIEAALD